MSQSKKVKPVLVKTGKKLTKGFAPGKVRDITPVVRAAVVATDMQVQHLNLSNMGQVMVFAKTLKEFVTVNGLTTEIQGNNYCNVDGWKFAGSSFGLTAIPTKPVAKHIPGQYITVLYAYREFRTKKGDKYTKEVPIFTGFTADKQIIDDVKKVERITKELTRPYIAYECDCTVVKLNDQTVTLSRGTGYCSNMELLKSGFDEYAVISMCETRGIGKAYRNLIGYVIKAAGFEPTPAEEMSQEYVENNIKAADADLPIMTDLEFDAACEKIMSKEMTIEHLEKFFTIGEDQLSAFKNIINRKNAELRKG